MKRNPLALSIFIFSLIVLLLANCRRDDPQPKSISDVLLADEEFSTLRTVIEYAGLTDAFKTGYGFTLFAPTNAAFQASGFADAAAITSALSVGQARSVLQYHLLRQKNLSSDFKNGLNYATKTFADTNTAYLSNLDARLFINGAKVVKTDLEATNGVVQGIDRVLAFPSGDWLSTLRNNPDLSLAFAVFDRALKNNPTNPLLAQLNNKSETFTFFLPNNKAMEAAGLNKVTIEKTAPALLATFVLTHTARGRYFTGTIGGTLALIDSGRAVTIAASATRVITLKSQNMAIPATIIQPDLIATNGVIHVIDKVLVF